MRNESDCIPLIISGAPRSGTSLLYNLLDGHGDIFWMMDEAYLFEYIYDLRTDGLPIFLDAVPEDANAMVDGLRDKHVMPPMHRSYRQSRPQGTVSEVEIRLAWDENMFRKAIAQSWRPGIEGLWRHFVLSYLAGVGDVAKRYACIKSPDYGKSASATLSTMAESRAIIIVRDPLYAIDSLKRSRELRGENLLTWPLMALTIRKYKSLYERIESIVCNRLKLVRYETLVRQPEEAMRELADWLEIEFEPCLLSPTMRGQEWPGISSFQATVGIEESPANRSIVALTGREQELVRGHLKEFRTTFNYD